jgi:hypothetical protein
MRMTGSRNEHANDDDVIGRTSRKIRRELRLDAGRNLRRFVDFGPFEEAADGWRGCFCHHLSRWRRRQRRGCFLYRNGSRDSGGHCRLDR